LIKKIALRALLSVALLLVWQITPSRAWSQTNSPGSTANSGSVNSVPRRVTETKFPPSYNLSPILSATSQGFNSPWEVYRFIPQPGFSQLSPYTLQPGQAWLIENGEIRAGRFDKRKGYQAYNDDLDGVTYERPIIGLFKWQRKADSLQLLTAAQNPAGVTNIFYDNQLDGTFAKDTTTLKSSNSFNFVDIDKRLVVVNGADSARIWSGSQLSVWGLIDEGISAFLDASVKGKLYDPNKNWPFPNELRGFFLHYPDVSPETRWVTILNNTDDTLKFDTITLSYSYKTRYQIWSLPIAGANLDSQSLDSIKLISGVIWKLFVGNHPFTASQYLGKPLFLQVVSGKGHSFGDFIQNTIRGGDTADYYQMVIDTSRWKPDTSSVLIVYLLGTPKPRYVVRAKGKVFYAYNASPAFKNHIYFTEEDDPATTSDEFQMMKTINFLSVETQDGDEITGLANQYAELANQFINLNIFKNSYIFELSGNDITDFQLLEVSSKVGCVAPRSIANYKDGVFFLDITGPYVKQGSQLTYFGADIRPIIDSINKKYIYKSSAVVWKDNYYLSYPAGSDTFPSATLCYNIPSGKWTGKFNFGSSVWITSTVPSDTFEVQFGDPTQGKVYNYGHALTDTGLPITFSWQSYLDLTKPEFTKHWREAWLDYYSADSAVTLLAKNDFDTTTKVSASLTGSGRQFKVQDLGSKLFNRRLFLDLRTKASSIELGQVGIKVRNVREPR